MLPRKSVTKWSYCVSHNLHLLFWQSRKEKNKKSNLEAYNKNERRHFYFKMSPWHLDIYKTQYLTFTGDKTVKEIAAVFLWCHWTGVIPFHTTETGWISCWCPQEAHMEPVVTCVAFPQIGQKIPQANKRVLVTDLCRFRADILPNRSILSKVQLKNRMSLYHWTNTNLLIHKGKSNTTLVFSTVCLPVTSTLTHRATLFGARSNPLSGLPLVLEHVNEWWHFFYNESYCVCSGLP